MGCKEKYQSFATLFLSLLVLWTPQIADAQIGVCYGMIGTGLPSPSDAIALFNQYNIQRIRMYYTDAPTLQALRGSNIQVMLDVANTELQNVAASQANANSWVQSRIQTYSNVKFRYITVGNEVSPLRSESSQYVQYVLPALTNIYNAIQSAGLGSQIRVSTAFDMGLLGNSYPPADGAFRADVNYYVDPIIQFLVNTNAPLFFNIYPYFAYRDNTRDITLEYALGTSGITVNGIHYNNIFSAMLDAVYASVERRGGSALEVVVSESGWPSSGGTSTTVDNADTYYTNLYNSVQNGTPKRPGKVVETYLFAMFDENQKSPAYEQNFGLFRANRDVKYQRFANLLLNPPTVAPVGVCYGMIGTGLPSPSDAIALFNQYNIQRIRMYYTDAPTLQALRGTNIQVMLDVANTELQNVAASQANANSWVQSRIQTYNNVKFRYITVGNEVSPLRSESSQYVQYVLPALNNIYNAIQSAGLGSQIKVSTAFETGLLGNTYPPADGAFRADVSYHVDPIIQFLVRTGAPLFFNIYPYFAYIGNPSAIGLGYALGTSGTVVNGITYPNIFSAMLDAVYAAVERKGGSSMEVVVSESGWPSAGGTGSAATATTVGNAATYYTKLIQSVRNGTPKRPGKAVETYLFAMFDENQKSPGSEQNFGLFHANRVAKYPITNFNNQETLIASQ